MIDVERFHMKRVFVILVLLIVVPSVIFPYVISDNRKKMFFDLMIINKKYRLVDNNRLFKKILPGYWLGPPHANFTFKKNGFFITKNLTFEKGKVIKGKWWINKEYIFFRTNNIIYKRKVEYFIFKKSKYYKGEFIVSLYIDKMIFWSDSIEIKFRR